MFAAVTRENRVKGSMKSKNRMKGQRDWIYYKAYCFTHFNDYANHPSKRLIEELCKILPKKKRRFYNFIPHTHQQHLFLRMIF